MGALKYKDCNAFLDSKTIKNQDLLNLCLQSDFAFLGGSVAQDHATPCSDLDIYLLEEASTFPKITTASIETLGVRLDQHFVPGSLFNKCIDALMELNFYNGDLALKSKRLVPEVDNAALIKLFGRLYTGKVLKGRLDSIHGVNEALWDKYFQYTSRYFYLVSENYLEDTIGYMEVNDVTSATLQARRLLNHLILAILNNNKHFVDNEKWIPIYLNKLDNSFSILFEQLNFGEPNEKFVDQVLDQSEAINQKMFGEEH